MGYLHFKRNGNFTRSFFFALPVLIALQPCWGWEDFFETVAGVDYNRQIWARTDPCKIELLSESIPGLERENPSCNPQTVGHIPPRLSASVNLDYHNLIQKSGNFSFAHNEIVPSFDLRFNPIPKLEIRSTIENPFWNRNIGDTSLHIDENGSAFQSHNSIALAPVPWFKPFVGAGWYSQGGWEYALGLKGAQTSPGLSWSLAAGHEDRTFPMTLKLEKYDPISVPFLLRQNFEALSLCWRHRLLSAAWTGRFQTSSYPSSPDGLYTLSDSGQNFKQVASISLSDSGSKNRHSLSLEGEYNSGSHVFRGVRNQNGLYQFGYENTENRDYSLRLDYKRQTGRWEWGTHAASSALDWNALRPDIPSGKYFWDRNGVLDSYNGSIAGIFDRETWLYNGNLKLRQWVVGTGLARDFHNWRSQFGLTYHDLDFQAQGHATKKNTQDIFFYTLQESYQNFPGIKAGLLMPELRLSRRLGRAFFEASLGQAIPLYIRFRGENVSGSGSQEKSMSPYSGGTQASVKAGWGVY